MYILNISEDWHSITDLMLILSCDFQNIKLYKTNADKARVIPADTVILDALF